VPDGGALPGWPRALRADLAAAYVGLGETTFREVVATEVPPVRLTEKRVAWLREDLDRWLDRRAGRGATPGGEPNPWDDP
jgi:predicted DNA-binding transcriptional regulator AlpA